MSISVTLKQLLEAGVHFGHQTRRWNPKMAPFIFAARNGIHIINLEKTLAALNTTCEFLRQLAAEGRSILLVGTKKQAQEIIKDAGEATEMPYVNQRWLGGMLTNFETVRKSISRLDQIEAMEQEGTYQFLTKKEVNSLKKEREKLVKVLHGIRRMKKLPAALFIVDPVTEDIAVREARKLGVPIAALIDTNCDPDMVDHLIPGNDDAIRSIKLIVETVRQVILEGRNEFKHILPEGEAAEVETPVEGEAALPVGEIIKSAEEIAEVVEEEVVSKLSVEEKDKAKVKKPRTGKSE